MTLDEEIKQYEELAELNEDQARVYKEQGDTMGHWSYEECAKEHRQLAEWLRELKAYRDDCDYKTLKIKLENAEDTIRGLQEELRDAREELRWRIEVEVRDMGR